LDSEGAQHVQRLIDEKKVSKQIKVKIEDVSQPLPYENEYFDFIYARLVLHYLSRVELGQALNELYRILKNEGRLFIVVRSSKCQEAKNNNPTVDLFTGLTTYTSNGGGLYKRYFHSEDSIQEYLLASGYTIKYITSYEERICVDFQRTILAPSVDTLIEVLVSKPKGITLVPLR
jgi:ubiquinone/menaquinone biosynthesis C-methylase UbiE